MQRSISKRDLSIGLMLGFIIGCFVWDLLNEMFPYWEGIL